MSERERPDQEPRVSPYLLRPARTYEEYLRDRAIADRVQQQFEDGAPASVSATKRTRPAKPNTPAWKHPNASADAALAVAGQRDSRDTANNQT
jgi:hypothetical protein